MDLSTIKNTGKWDSSAASLNENFSKVGTEVDKLKYAAYNSKLYATEALLKQAVPNPSVGDWAIVGYTIPGEIYQCHTDGVWSATGQTGGGYGMEVIEKNVTEQYVTEVHNEYTGDIVNNPDDEDLISEEKTEGSKVLKLADKLYNASVFSGMGRCYLRKNISGSKNLLTQAMVAGMMNTRFIVQYDYDLNGQTVTVPEGCVLVFQGGSFNNGTIIFNNTFIEATSNIFGESIILEGAISNSAFNMDWWKVKPNTNADFRGIIQYTVNVANRDIIFNEGVYIIKGLKSTIDTAYPGISRQFDGIIPKSNISFIGNNTVLLCDESSYYLFNTQFTSDSDVSDILNNVTFKGITFKYEGNTFIEYSCLLNLESVTNLIIDNCIFSGWRGDALQVAFRNNTTYSKVMPCIVKNIIIRNCLFDGITKNNRQAISFLNAENVLIDNCTFKNTTKTGMPGAIDFEPELATDVIKDIFINNCRFSDIGGSVGSICFVVSKSKLVTNINILNCVLQDCSFGISIYGYGSADGSIVENSPCNININNNILDNIRGINFTIGGVENVIMNNNTFTHDRTVSISSSLIGFDVGDKKYPCSNITMISNNFRGLFTKTAYSAPIYLRYSSFININNNIFDDLGYNDGEGNIGYAAFVSSDPNLSNIIISNNTFNNSKKISSCFIALRGSTIFNDPQSIKIYDNINQGISWIPGESSWYNICDVRDRNIKLGSRVYSSVNTYDESALPNSFTQGISIGKSTDNCNLLTIKGSPDAVDFLQTYQLKFNMFGGGSFYIRTAYEGNVWTDFKKYSGTTE